MKNLILITLIQIVVTAALAQHEVHRIVQIPAESFTCRSREDLGFPKTAEIVELNLKAINQLTPGYVEITKLSAYVHILNYACVRLKQLASEGTAIGFELIGTTVVLGPDSIHKTVELESLDPEFSFLNIKNTNATTKFSRKIKIPLSKITCGLEYDYNYLTGRTEFEVLHVNLQDINAMTPTFERVEELRAQHPLEDQVCERLKTAAAEYTELEFTLRGQLRYAYMYVEEPLSIYEVKAESLNSNFSFLNLSH